MKCKIILMAFCFIAFILTSCRNNKSKKDHIVTIALNNKQVFVEKYRIYGGSAYDGGIVSVYLTDSSNFRKYIGTYDNSHQSYKYECNGDSVRIILRENEDTSNNYKIVSQTLYSISFLKDKKSFD